MVFGDSDSRSPQAVALFQKVLSLFRSYPIFEPLQDKSSKTFKNLQIIKYLFQQLSFLRQSFQLFQKLFLRNLFVQRYFARMSAAVTNKNRVPGLRELFDQIEQWYVQAVHSDLQQSLEIKMFSVDRTVNQINIIPAVTHRGKVVNNLAD